MGTAGERHGQWSGWGWGSGGDKDTKAQAPQQSEPERSVKTSGPAPRAVKAWPDWGPHLVTKGLQLLSLERNSRNSYLSQTDTQIIGHPTYVLCICGLVGCVVCGLSPVSLFMTASESQLIHSLRSHDLLPSSLGWPPPRGTEPTEVLMQT